MFNHFSEFFNGLLTAHWYPSKENLGVVAIKANPPSVNVISLAFDSLEIPFEKVVPAAEPDIFARLSKISRDLKLQTQGLEAIKAGLTNTSFYFSANLLRGAVSNLLADATTVTVMNGFGAETNATFKTAFGNLVTMASVFGNQTYDVELVKSPTFGLEAMKTYELTMERISRDVLGGSDGKAYESTLTHIESAIEESQAGIRFYRHCADLLANSEFGKRLAAIQKNYEANKPPSQEDKDGFIREIKAVLEFREKYPFMPGLQNESPQQ